MEVIYYCTYL